MSKEDSKVLKGIAILLMVFYHLFYQEWRADLCVSFLTISGHPVVTILAKAFNPVPFFLILSGFGFYQKYKSNGSSSSTVRVIKLYIHYWISLLIFVPLAMSLDHSQYPGSLATVFWNISGWSSSYNPETWFLFPYCLLAISSHKIFSVVSRLNWMIAFGVTGLIYFVVYLSIHLYGDYLYNHMIVYLPILYLELLFSFVIGMLMAKHFDSLPSLSSTVSLIIIIVLISIRACIETGVFQPLFAAFFIYCAAFVKFGRIPKAFLKTMGRHSTCIWLIHTWFCYYLFSSFIYSFRYPIVVFCVLLLISFLVSLVIDWVYEELLKILKI